MGTPGWLAPDYFKELVLLMCTESGMTPLPNPADLTAAFYLADDDKNGVIDM